MVLAGITLVSQQSKIYKVYEKKRLSTSKCDLKYDFFSIDCLDTYVEE